MFFTGRGIDMREQYAFEFLTYKKFLALTANDTVMAEFFKKNQYKRIAVHGLGILGKCLYKELNHTDICIEFFVDRQYKKYKNGFFGIPVISCQDIKEYKDIDVIVITSVWNCNDIIDELLDSGFPLEKIINLNDVLYGSYKK